MTKANIWVVLLVGVLLPMFGCASPTTEVLSNSEGRPKLRSVAFVGANNTWLVNAKTGDLWATNDGGANWRMIPGSTVDNRFQSISFIDEKTGFASNADGKIWKSVDAGSTWVVSAKLPASDQWQFISSDHMRFIDRSHGWLDEALLIWRTSDGGSTWTPLFSVEDEPSKGQPDIAFFLDSSVAWVSNTSGQLYRTTDAGKGWTRIPLDSITSVTDILFINSQLGWVATLDSSPPFARIFRTTDGGNTWTHNRLPNPKAIIDSVYFLNEREGWAAGTVWTGDPSTSLGLLMRTSDGGQSWTQSNLGFPDEYLSRIYFANNRNGWLFGKEKVYRTQDGGASWQLVLNIRVLPPN